jgi:broad specificity phosphatase PhoE
LAVATSRLIHYIILYR